MKYCSICGNKNTFSFIEGRKRYHCEKCLTIHYQNPKPTATIICLKKNKILYGGSVNSRNIKNLKNITNIDGFLIGGASQNSKKFIDIIKKTYI